MRAAKFRTRHSISWVVEGPRKSDVEKEPNQSQSIPPTLVALELPKKGFHKLMTSRPFDVPACTRGPGFGTFSSGGGKEIFLFDIALMNDLPDRSVVRKKIGGKKKLMTVPCTPPDSGLAICPTWEFDKRKVRVKI